jgi:hypothetical protein
MFLSPYAGLMSMSKIYPLKRSRKGSVAMRYLDKTGEPININQLGIEIFSQIRDSSGRLVSSLPVTISQDPQLVGMFYLYIDPTSWPLGLLKWDVMYKYPSNDTDVTETQQFLVSEGVTIV